MSDHTTLDEFIREDLEAENERLRGAIETACRAMDMSCNQDELEGIARYLRTVLKETSE